MTYNNDEALQRCEEDRELRHTDIVDDLSNYEEDEYEE